MRPFQGDDNGPERDGRDAIESLIRNYLPLAYNIVGWALNGSPDIGRFVQAAMTDAFRGDGQPGDTEAFRSRMVAACVRQVREARQAHGSRGSRPDPDFVKLMVEWSGLGGEQREILQSSRWLDDEDRLLLVLWWQEAAGALTRAELAHALRQSPAALARSIAALTEPLQESRVVDRALRRTPACGGLAAAANGWDRKPTPAWRDLLAAHVHDCPACLPGRAEFSPADRLLGGIPLLPPPPSLAAATLRSTLGDDLQASRVANAELPGATGHRRLPANRSGVTRGGVRWTRSAVAAVASGVVLCVLVAAIAIVHRNGPSSTAASATGKLPTSTPSAQPATSSGSPAAPAGHNGSTAAAAADYKGVGIVAGPDVSTDLVTSGASWYYNWAATPNGIGTTPGVAFVPMIKTPSDVSTSVLSEVRREGKYLLTFNEPDVTNEADMSVAQALDLWPRLEATGMELGSPAVSYGTNSTTSWIGQFMDGARARGYRVNFVTVHWYGQHHWTDPAANVTELKTYLEQTYDLYHLPIWITEFSLINFSTPTPAYPTPAQQATFLSAAAKMLTGLPFVQRYAWYTLTGTQNGGTTILYNDGTTAPTVVAAAFKQAP